MDHRKVLRFMCTGVTVLSFALCVPAAMLAQSTPPPDSSAMATSQSGAMTMHRHRRMSPQRRLKRMTKMLNLTADQQQQMLPILQDQQQQMKSMHEDTSLSPEQRRQQGRTLMKDTNQKLEALMTDSQKQQYEQHMQQRRDHMRNHRMGQGSGSAGAPDDSGTPPPPPQQ